jgi:hypothetical protein
MAIPGIISRLLCVGVCCVASAAFAHAADITGAWATDASACNKIFSKKGGTISLTRDADLYGSGFIIDGNRIRAKIASCRITSRKEDGATVHLVASCATDIMLSSVQFSMKVIDQNRIARTYPGIPELETPYERCAL